MKMTPRVLLFAALLSLAAPICSQTPTPTQRLDDALIKLAKANHWIILASLQAPIPLVMPVAEMTSHLTEVARELRRELPGYTVTISSDRILLVEAQSASSPFKKRLLKYYMPPNLGQLKTTLPNALVAAEQPKTSVGSLGSGLVSSVDLAVPLKGEMLRNVSGNEILARAGAEVNGLASILVLDANLKSKVDDSPFRNWELVAGPRLSAYPGEPPKEVERAAGPAFPPVKRQKPN